LLPWHHATFRHFRDEDAVSQVLAENAPCSGVYGLPAAPEAMPGMSREDRQAVEAAVRDRMKRGPLGMAIIQCRGFGSLPRYLLGALAIIVFASLLPTGLLLQPPGITYLGRVGFVAVAALAGAVI